MFGTTRGVQLGWNNSGWRIGQPEYEALYGNARSEERIQKAFTTGNSVVTDGTTGGAAARKQFLFGEIELQSATQKDAALVRLCPHKDAKSTLLEWTLQNNQNDQAGDGFTNETGSDGIFGVDFYDDPLERMTETMGFLAQGRQISEVAQQVDNLMDPEAIARRGMMISMFKSANVAGYFGDRVMSATQFNGIVPQLRNWCDRHNDDYGVMFDCGGKPIDRDILQQGCTENGLRYGEGDMLLMSLTAKSDTSKILWPERREQEGTRNRNFGGQYEIFDGPDGPVKLVADKMLRAGRPLRVDGIAANGAVRTIATMDSNSLIWAGGNPFSAVAAAAAGNGNFWVNFTKNTDTSALATVPALPSGSTMELGGNNDNRLAVGNYYYAVAAVYKGFEGPAYVYGAGTQANNAISGSPTAVVVSSNNPVVSLTLDITQITGIGQSFPRNLIKFRIYRAGGPNATAPTRMQDFKFLQETGIPISGGSTITVDNGFSVPGSDNAFLITRKKDQVDEWGWMNLLPLMQKTLPILAMGDQFVLLWFTMILLRNRRRHIWFRNVGRAN